MDEYLDLQSGHAVQKNVPHFGGALIASYFFIAPPGDVASPFFSADPAVIAPCVLASFADGMEVPAVVGGAPFFIAVPPPPVVLPFMASPVVVLLAAGPPALESPPAVLPAWANASVLESTKAAASEIVLTFMVVSSLGLPLEKTIGWKLFRSAAAGQHKHW